MDRPPTMPPEPRSISFIPVPCACGRGLRAKPDQVGTEIRCWDCRRMVLVAVPRTRQRVAREFSDGMLGVIRGPGLRHLLAAAAILTMALSVPFAGLVVAGVVLSIGAAVHGEIIRRVSCADRGEEQPGWWAVLLPRSFSRALLCVLMAAGTVGPLWGLNPGWHRSPHWTPVGALMAGLAWSLLPIAMLFVYGSDLHGRPEARRCLGLIAGHPIATLLALMVVPASLAFADAAMGLAFYWLGKLPFFALEFMPMSGEPVMHDGVPHYHSVDFRSFPQTRFLVAYLDGLWQGYTFSAAIPASLSMSTRGGLNPSILHMIPPIYFLVRVLLTFAIVTCLLTGFAIQARWLGTIVAVDKKRPA